MSDSTEVQIEIETYQLVVEQMLSAKDKEIITLRAHIAQMEKNATKPNNVINPDVKGV